jgi:hypothetical protein
LCRETSIIFHTDALCSAAEVQKPARNECPEKARGSRTAHGRVAEIQKREYL